MTLAQAKQRHEAARDRVTILTALANRRTADPVRVLADLEAAVIEEHAALKALLLSEEAQQACGQNVGDSPRTHQ